MNLWNKRALAAAVGAVAGATASLFMISSPALADYQCPQKQVCFYQDKNRQGSPATLADLAQGGAGVRYFDQHKFHNGVNLNDQASSVHNNTNQWLRVYEHTAYNSGRSQLVAPGGWANFTGDELKNDTASSAQFVPEPCGQPWDC